MRSASASCKKLGTTERWSLLFCGPKRLRFSPPDAGKRAKGDILSRERMSPFKSPKRTQGALPLDPAIGRAGLKNCTRCAIGCGVHGFAMSPYDSFSFATAPFYREARVTTSRRQTACRMRHYCTRRIDECLGRRKLGCTATRLAERQRIIEAEASRIAEPMAVSVSNTATQAVAFRRQKAPSSPRLPI